MLPKVSIVIPSYNEKEYVTHVLEDILSQDYPHDLLEVFFIDGGSTDGSNEIIRQYAVKYDFIEYLHDNKFEIPSALNMGIHHSDGEVIMFLNGHSRYHDNYISTLIKYMIKLQADVVGGETVYMPANGSIKAFAIAECMSQAFGTGNKRWKKGDVRAVNSVTLGCYRKNIFDEIGDFDTELLKNQDDELNARLKRRGGRIFQVSEVKVMHFTHAKIKDVARKFFDYGYYKPLVFKKKHSYGVLRQFVPPAFILLLLIFWICSLFSNSFLFLFFGIIIMHFISGIIVSFKTYRQKRKFVLFFLMPFIFFIMHGSYGWGFLSGIVRFWFRFNNNKSAGLDSSVI